MNKPTTFKISDNPVVNEYFNLERDTPPFDFDFVPVVEDFYRWLKENIIQNQKLQHESKTV